MNGFLKEFSPQPVLAQAVDPVTLQQNYRFFIPPSHVRRGQRYRVFQLFRPFQVDILRPILTSLQRWDGEKRCCCREKDHQIDKKLARKHGEIRWLHRETSRHKPASRGYKSDPPNSLCCGLRGPGTTFHYWG